MRKLTLEQMEATLVAVEELISGEGKTPFRPNEHTPLLVARDKLRDGIFHKRNALRRKEKQNAKTTVS